MMHRAQSYCSSTTLRRPVPLRRGVSMPKIDVKNVRQRKGSSYPAPFHEKAGDRVKQPLGDAGGLTDFGVNLTFLPPGAWSSQRHWHEKEDEFVYVLAG